MICTVEGCGTKIASRGLCHKHWQRAKADGSLVFAPRLRGEWGSGNVGINGYRYVTINGSRVLEHVAVAEKALGHALPVGAVIHHIDHDRLNNVPTNLLVCPDSAYHNLIHLREEAFDASGHADWRRCAVCKTWDDPADLRFMSSGKSNASPKVVHAECYNACRREYRARAA